MTGNTSSGHTASGHDPAELGELERSILAIVWRMGASTARIFAREGCKVVVADQMDNEALITRLISIKGVGRWTVEMLLIYSLERMDVLPADDFGVREGYRVLKSLPEQPKPRAMRELAQAWSPHRTVASWYLWRIPRTRGQQP